MGKSIKINYLFLIGISIFLTLLIGMPGSIKAESLDLSNLDYIYLSDISYQSGSAYGNITMDKTSSNQPLSLILEGSTVTFDKGIFAHAKSTLIYDLTEYTEAGFYYFTTYYGVSAIQGSKGNVKFYIYTSKDGTNWDLKISSNPKTGATEADKVKIDIHDAKYLKLYADPNGGNGNDHALYGDCMFIKQDYNENITITSKNGETRELTLDYYDERIKRYNIDELTKNSELELLVLQREFVKRVGSYTLKTFIKQDPTLNQETLEWLLNDQETLRLYLVRRKTRRNIFKIIASFNYNV